MMTTHSHSPPPSLPHFPATAEVPPHLLTIDSVWIITLLYCIAVTMLKTGKTHHEMGSGNTNDIQEYGKGGKSHAC
ncbi:hypothetical protein E2C01_076720 [Portunus trituberculatus]|uniref:Uncharacterized protein n=1 Tax=Portunus trituberculatus TaxID=210409 RepID=A0A5B7IIH3_PORTR|nr:hypothetical protein [Portunus trituberculatus]